MVCHGNRAQFTDSSCDLCVNAATTKFMLLFHAGFSLFAAILLEPIVRGKPPYFTVLVTSGGDASSGLTISTLVVFYTLGFLCAGPPAALRNQLVFAAILSVFQVVPDLFLASVLGALHFPDDGCPLLFGHVSAYMAGMWTIPILAVLWISDAAPKKVGQRGGLRLPTSTEMIMAALTALLVFGLAEEVTFPLGLWHATDKVQHKLNHVALLLLLLPPRVSSEGCNMVTSAAASVLSAVRCVDFRPVPLPQLLLLLLLSPPPPPLHTPLSLPRLLTAHHSCMRL